MTGHPRLAALSAKRSVVLGFDSPLCGPHDERIDRAAIGELLGAVEDRLVAFGVPIVVVAEVLDVHRAVRGSDGEHTVVPRCPVTAEVLDGANPELLDAERQRHVDGDPRRDGLFEDDEVGAGRGSGHDAARAEIGEHLGDALVHERHEGGGERGVPRPGRSTRLPAWTRSTARDRSGGRDAPVAADAAWDDDDVGNDAFISYSHAADGVLAPALERGMERLARPWYRVRALSVFRDQSDLAVTPHLWETIRLTLDGSRYLVALLSPESASSKWVNQELAYWCAERGTARVAARADGR